MQGNWRAYFELMRFPAVFTAVADVMMGYLVTHGNLEPIHVFALLAVASSSMYLAGMVLNDVLDADVDAVERPERPIPSGRIAQHKAKRLAWGLLGSGVGLALLSSALTSDWRPAIVGTALAVCIVLYDRVFKWTPIAPVVMGSCRLLNVLLGMSLAARAWTPTDAAIAAGVGVYIVGVTWFARSEARPEKRGEFLPGMVVMSFGLLLLQISGRIKLRPAYFISEQEAWPLMWLAILAVILGRCLWAVWQLEPRAVQIAARNLLRALIVIDAAIVLGFCGPYWSSAILALLVPMIILERWASTT